MEGEHNKQMSNKPIKEHTVVISAFPACGKSTLVSHNDTEYLMCDSDSSKFSWIYKDGKKTDTRNPNFINDYVEHIKSSIGYLDVIFVSSHAEVRHKLQEEGIKYFLVYPSLSMKDTMLERMRQRGNSEQFIQFQSDNYEQFVTAVMQEYEDVVNTTPYTDGMIKRRILPYHLIELSEKRPYIDREMIYELLDNSMGNLSQLFWNTACARR